jgi:hypothetical protein
MKKWDMDAAYLSLCGDKLRIKSPLSHQMDAAAEQWSQWRWHMYPNGPGYLQ